MVRAMGRNDFDRRNRLTIGDTRQDVATENT